VANLMGFELFDWQRRVADVALERKDGHYIFRTVGASVGRQGGKSKLIEVRIAFELLQARKHIAYTAQDRAMAKLKWLEHVQSFERTPQIARQIHKISYINGSERLYMKNGSSYGIVTPNDKGARGLSLNLMVIDEALTHPLSLLASLQPTLATRRSGQLWIVSNAGIPGRSQLLEHFRTVAHSRIDDRSTQLAWFEWSPQQDKFDYLDEGVWREAIPTLGQKNGVLLDAVREAAHTSSPEIFTKEWLNVWPAIEAVQVIPTDLWDGLARTDVTVGKDVVLGVDISPVRDKSAIAVSGLVNGLTPVEIVEAKDGANWVADRLIEIAQRWKAPVVIDQGAPASSLIVQLENAGITVISLGLRDYARACGSFYDAVQARTICHLDDPNLRQAIIGSSRRALGDSWAWRRHDTNNITPLVAATLARYGVVNKPIEQPVQRSKIF
jgi:phage terminase large subunit-like protein